MVAMLALAVGKAERRRICTWVRGSVIPSLEGGGDRRRQRHTETICQIKLSAFVVDGWMLQNVAGIQELTNVIELSGFENKSE